MNAARTTSCGVALAEKEKSRRFAHFNPTGWGIELNYMLTIMPVALDSFEHLTTTQGRPNIHFTP
jgi:hypothetical protein